MKTNLKKQNRRGKEEGEQPDTQIDDDYLGMGQLELRNFNKKVLFSLSLAAIVLFLVFRAKAIFVFHFQIQE